MWMLWATLLTAPTPTARRTLAGAGLKLVTSYVVDSLGSVTEQTNPNGTVVIPAASRSARASRGSMRTWG
jgi:hypothetical protein